jgi:hypothetical protein
MSAYVQPSPSRAHPAINPPLPPSPSPSTLNSPLTNNPLQSLTEEEQKLFRLYGKLPSKKDLLQTKLKERKYFDSGDYALSKAGKSDNALVGGLGHAHPSPDTIPHLSQQVSNTGAPDSQHGRGSISSAAGGAAGAALTPTVSHGQAGSPVKESLLQRGTSVDEQDSEEVARVAARAQGGGGEEEVGGVPIRQ